MSQHLSDLITPEAAGSELRLWLKSYSYTRRLLLGESGDPWESASRYLVYFSQAQGLLKPDVAVIEVGELFEAFLTRNPTLRGELSAKRSFSYPLRRLLEEAHPRELLAEIVEAVLNQLRCRSPLILSMPSPQSWLLRANRAAGREQEAPEADSIEDAAMYLADLARSVSGYAVGGVLLEESPSPAGSAPVDPELYRPLVNVAKHYRWPLALRVGSAGALGCPALSEFDVLLGEGALPAAGSARGIDVSRELWGGKGVPELRPCSFYFAEIPEDAQPELVLERLGALR